MTPQFVDISVFNPASIDWQAYKAWSASGDGVSRVAMRSSYGTGYADSHFAEYRAGALAAGIDQIIFYHYSYPEVNNANAEANWQHQVVGQVRPQDVLMLDYEENAGQATFEWALTWLQTQEGNYGKLPGIYASSYYISQHLQDARLARYPLWLANWQYTPDERPPVPAPWSQYEWVQYTDRAAIPGMAGTVDADIFLGKETPNVNNTTYGPGQGDFDHWFTVTADGNWTCKQTGATLIGGNKALYSQLSIDGNTLPVIGLPKESEQYQADGSSRQRCERAMIIYDPKKNDNQPGMGNSYLGFVSYDPPTITIEKLPASATADFQQIATSVQSIGSAVQSMAQIADRYKVQ
jgi:lysozyme